ncbi:MAG: D-alanine--D-alanine ligase [Candidatus Cloacimonadales bacterium]|jgi:D-alanine-D-alanine ligase|nr:D-alanine--D-alanine ligase [Candidatus Cloacimonadales bacterium]HQB40509.1 D-alanine--D-alanine ligase [Candidatus Cloacimonadota bacterium]
MTKKIIVLCGGFSDEKEISMKSSSAISAALLENNYKVELVNPSDFHSYSELLGYLKMKKPYIVFNGLHGAEGEDGRIQSLLSLEGIPFTGTKHTGSAIAMNKYASTLIAEALKIPCPRQVLLTNNRQINESEMDYLQLPFIVKPNSNGSSVGVSIISKPEQVEKAVIEAYKHDNMVLCQEFIPGRELTVSILGDKTLPIVEIVPKEGFYDFNNKYTKGKTEYICPPDFSQQDAELVKNYAKTIFTACSCSVYGRVDFRYNGKDFYFLEINTLPGMTELSLTPMSAKAVGISFNELIKEIINLSLQD